MKRVVVAGGTGFIGKKLVASFLARGWLITVLTRRPTKARGLFDPRVRVAGWGGEDVAVWPEEVDGGVDAVINLAGEGVFDKRWDAARIEVLRKSRVETTAALARAIARAKTKPKVLVSASAVGIYGGRKDDEILDEDSAKGNDVLAKICRDWESAAEPARAAGVRVATPRLGIVLGPDGGALQKMVTPFKLRMGGPMGDGKQWASWVHWKDVVDALIFAAETPTFEGPFNLTAPNPATMNEMAEAIALVLNTHARARVPAAALKLMMGEGLANVLLTGQRAIPKKLEAVFPFSYPTSIPALESLLGPS